MGSPALNFDAASGTFSINGSPINSADTVVQLDDGSLYDQTTGIVYPLDGGSPYQAGAGLGTLGANPSMNQTSDSNSAGQDNANAASQIVNTLANFGIGLTSIFTRTPVATNNQGRPVGAAPTPTIGGFSMGQIILAGLAGLVVWGLFIKS